MPPAARPVAGAPIALRFVIAEGEKVDGG